MATVEDVKEEYAMTPLDWFWKGHSSECSLVEPCGQETPMGHAFNCGFNFRKEVEGGFFDGAKRALECFQFHFPDTGITLSGKGGGY